MGCLCPVVFALGDCDVVECLFQSCRVGNVAVFIKYMGETALGLLSTFTGGIVAGNFLRRVLHEVNQVGRINVRGLVRPVGIKVDVVVGNASADVVDRPPLGIRKDGVDPEQRHCVAHRGTAVIKQHVVNSPGNCILCLGHRHPVSVINVPVGPLTVQGCDFLGNVAHSGSGNRRTNRSGNAELLPDLVQDGCGKL